MRRCAPCLVFLLLAAPAFADGGIPRIRERGELVCAVVGRPPDAAELRSAAWAGPERPYLERIAQALGVPLRIESGESYEACLRLLESGRADVFVSGRGANAIDARAFRFTRPYRKNDLYLVIDRTYFAERRGTARFGLEELLRADPSARIGVDRRASVLGYLRGFPLNEVRYYEDQEAAADELLGHREQACIVDERVFRARIAADGRRLLYFRPVRISGFSEDVSMAVRWDNLDILRLLDLGLGERAYDD